MDEREPLTDRELEEWYRHAITRDDERTIGSQSRAESQSRDRKIRRLIIELRKERERSRRPND